MRTVYTFRDVQVSCMLHAKAWLPVLLPDMIEALLHSSLHLNHLLHLTS